MTSLRMTPARLATLAIGVPLVLILIGWTGFDAVALDARGSFPVSYVLPVQDGQLVANLSGGDVTLRPGQGTTARLTGTVQYDLVRPHVTESSTAAGTRLGVGCRVPVGSCGLNATLQVPPQTGITLSSGGGDLRVSGPAASVNLSSEGGDIAISGVGDLARVSTGGGDLSANDLAGIGQFSTSGGDISGDDLTAPSVNADSGGGDVALVFTKAPTNLDITSGGGDIAIVLPQGDTAYNVTSSAGGGDDSVSVPVSPSSTNTIHVDSGGGDITIAEAS